MNRFKIQHQAAFVLHSRPYLETSLLVDAMSRNYGRILLIAKGARRPRSAMRGLLMAFHLLEITWSGKGEVMTLHDVEWQKGLAQLQGRALLCGYYINELLIRLLPRNDAHKELFEEYRKTLSILSERNENNIILFSGCLRKFEKNMLRELGYGLSLTCDTSGNMICPGNRYFYEIELGPRLVEDDFLQADTVSGKTLLDMNIDSFIDPISRVESKRLMRRIIGFYLNGQDLHSRQLFEHLI